MCHAPKTCQQPENLNGSPEQCSAEKIRQCHGTSEDHPCTDKDQPTGCEHPEKLSDNPGECSPAQIRECHGDNDSHPCEQLR